MLTPEELQKLHDSNIGEAAGETINTQPQEQSQYKSLSDELGASLPDNRTFLQKTADVAKGIGSAIISNEKNFGDSISAAATNILPKSVTGEAQLEEARQAKERSLQIELAGLKKAKDSGGDTSKWLKMISETTGQHIPTMDELYPAIKKTNLQVAGEAAGVLVDILSAGSYGNAAKGAETGKLLTGAAQKEATAMAGQKAVFDWADKTGATVVADAAKKTTGQLLKEIGVNTMKRTAVGAGTGYAYDVANNLQEGKTGTEAIKPGMGTAIGGTLPALVGLYEAGRTITKSVAPRIINSLVKPRQAEFAYGKDPGRTVSQLGITANSMDDFGNKVSQARRDMGAILDASYQTATDQGVRLDLTDEISKIDDAIKTAVDGGPNNQGMADTLKNIKNALLYEQTLNDAGKITNKTNVPLNFSDITPNQALDLKTKIAGQTKFTGNPSDDKYVNTVLKSIYGGIKDKINTATKAISPEIPDLNEKYADLISAESAIKHRNDIVRRADLISLPFKITGAGGVSALVTGVVTGAVSIPVALAGVAGAGGALVLDKALSSVPFKTRVAAWLGKTDPGTIRKILQNNPQIGEVLYRAFPKMGAILNQ